MKFSSCFYSPFVNTGHQPDSTVNNHQRLVFWLTKTLAKFAALYSDDEIRFFPVQRKSETTIRKVINQLTGTISLTIQSSDAVNKCKKAMIKNNRFIYKIDCFKRTLLVLISSNFRHAYNFQIHFLSFQC